ncbi:MAG: aldo/keto reductase [Ilumatobacteraceae bacterium]
MQYVEVAGVRVSKIGLGCWQFGSREWGYGRAYAADEAVKITNKALDVGINLIDTAEIYGFGQSERIVGRSIAGRRDEAFVATKIWPLMPIAPVVVNRGRRSARRLGIETIDLYQVHQANPVVPDAVTMDGMRRLQRDGVIRQVGVSNYSLGRWERAEAALGSPVLSNQVEYSLAHRRPDRDLVPFAARNDRLIIAYSPLAQGFLAAKYDASHQPGGIRLTNPLFLEANLSRGQELLNTLRSVAEVHGATPAQVALAWVIRRRNVVAIPGASSVDQLVRNAEAAELELTDDEDAHLTSASDQFQPLTGVAAAPAWVSSRLSAAQHRQ